MNFNLSCFLKARVQSKESRDGKRDGIRRNVAICSGQCNCQIDEHTRNGRTVFLCVGRFRRVGIDPNGQPIWAPIKAYRRMFQI